MLRNLPQAFDKSSVEVSTFIGLQIRQIAGLLFESLEIRDLRIYAQAADTRVYQYREKDGLEVDAIVETEDGRWAAFEIKLGERWIAEGKKNLLRLADRLAGTDHGEPAALAVILPNGCGHFRPGEVGIVPINALGP